jgi:hypothetical protein
LLQVVVVVAYVWVAEVVAEEFALFQIFQLPLVEPYQ